MTPWVRNSLTSFMGNEKKVEFFKKLRKSFLMFEIFEFKKLENLTQFKN
jgi:hypothetical protein